jgi:hypothetical protein
MNNDPSQQPPSPITPAVPVNQVQSSFSPPLQSPASSTGNKVTDSLDAYENAVASVHSAGTWAFVLGLLNIVVSPLLGFLIYNQSSSNGGNELTLVIIVVVTGLIVGGTFVSLGLKLKQTTTGTLRKADRMLQYVAVIIGVVLILGLIQGGRSVGLLNLLAVFKVAQAREKIKKLGKE